MSPRGKQPLFGTVAVLGLGLIGGSIAMAIKEKGLARRVIGANRGLEGIRFALKKRAIDEGTRNYIRATAGVDLVVLATTIRTIPQILQVIAPTLKKGAIVVDVGSTKVDIVREGEDSLQYRAHFVGGHPMAGSHQQGMGAASAEILKGKKFFLTSTSKTSAGALARVKRLVREMEMDPIVLSPVAHDALMAHISHLPIAIAVSLMNTVSNVYPKGTPGGGLSGPAFKDMTRIAMGSMDMSEEILHTNRKEVIRALQSFRKNIDKIQAAISAKRPLRLRSLLQSAHSQRHKLDS